MKPLITLALAATLAACGGSGGPPMPIAQCNGASRAAIVYVGQAPFPELAAVPNVCVYSTQAASVADLDMVIDKALTAASRPRVYLIGAYTGLPLAWRAARPGIGEITSLWFVPDGTKADGIAGNEATVYVNDTSDGAQECNALAAQLVAQRTPAQCTLWDHGGFTADQRAAAIAQLHLELIQ